MSYSRALIAAPLIVLALAGCVPTSPDSTPTPTLPPVTLAPNPTPTITATPSPETVPLSMECSDLLTAQAIYDYNPNVSLLPSFSPDASSPAGRALADQGIACSLVNQTSGATIDFGLVQLTDEAFAARSAAVTATPSSDFDGYFDVIDGVGTAQVFSAPYYLTVTSDQFSSASDMTELVQMALSQLG